MTTTKRIYGMPLLSIVVAVTGVVLIAALVTVFSLGLNVYFRIQNVLFAIAMVGLILWSDKDPVTGTSPKTFYVP